MPVDFWLSDGGAPFERAFTEGVEKIALNEPKRREARLRQLLREWKSGTPD